MAQGRLQLSSASSGFVGVSLPMSMAYGFRLGLTPLTSLEIPISGNIEGRLYDTFRQELLHQHLV